MDNRFRGRKIFSQLTSKTNNSIRKIAKRLGISKSSVGRHKASINKRNQHPESHFWETDEGYAWLRLLYFGAILFFGVHCCIGAEKLSAFFKLIRLERHIGISPSTIKGICSKTCDLLEEYQKQQEQKFQLENPVKIVGGIDETYFNNMILVLMDLSSGFIFAEETSDDKSYETWFDMATIVSSRFNIEFKFFVSDRARQLIKLAVQGFSCPSIPDLFHASNDLVKLFGLNLNRKKARVQKKIAKEIAKLIALKELSQDISTQTIIVKKLRAQELVIEEGISTYRTILYKLSVMMHPFDIVDSSPVNSAMIEISLNLLFKETQELKREHEISSKIDYLNKFQKQIREMASLMDTWWLRVDESLNDDQLNRDLKNWLIQYLLPTLYWHRQAAKTKNPDLKEAYQYAWEKTEAILNTHPATQNHMKNEEWISWAKQMVSNFQRTSSAVEGRNGWLTQMHHNGRGLTPKRLKAQTVIHNYYLKRCDGTTAAERLLKQEFSNPLIWVIERMGDLPLPRISVRRCEM